MIADLKPYPVYKDSGVPWLGEVPEHWYAHRLRNLAEMRVSSVDKLSREGEEPVRLCNYVDVYKHDFIRPDMKFMRATATKEEKERFHLSVGDVLITKDSEAWNDIGVPALVHQTADDLVSGYHLALLRPFVECMMGPYLFRALQSSGAQYQFHVEANGVTRYGLSHAGIKSVWLPVPPLPEQAAIVRFLDWANSRLDRAIRAKRKMIKLLEEQKQAIIHQAVTRGLDPNVKLKPSGVEWLGDVPEHWEVLPFVRCTVERTDYRGATPDKVDVGIFLVTAKNIKMGWIDYNCSREFVRVEDYTRIMRRGLPKLDDILLTMEAPLGHVALVDREGIAIAQRVVRFRLNADKLISNYALIVLNSHYFQNQLLQRATGSTAQGIKASKLPQLLIVCPPRQEQDIIVAQLDLECSPLSTAISRLEREIELLREYRTRLIADVVTGKLDVREAAAQLPEVLDDPALPDEPDLEEDALDEEDVDASVETEEA